MRNVFIGLSACVAILAAEPVDEALNIEISEVKSKIKVLDKELKSLQSKLPKKQPDNSFVTHTELGYIKNSGNTETETFNIDAKGKKQWRASSITVALDSQYAKDKDETTKNRYTIELNYGYDLSKDLTFGYLVGFKKDKFSGYDYQSYTGPELLYKLLNSNIQTLTTEVAALYSQDKIEDKDIKRYGSYRFKGVYELKIYSNIEFYQDATYRGSFENSTNYFVTTKTALSSRINSTFSAGISYKIDYSNIIPDDKVRTDKTLTANLIIDY